MAGALPTIKTGAAVVSFGTTRGVGFKTKTLKFLDRSEQRWAVRGALGGFTLVYTDISGYDLSQIRAFWRTQKGAKDATWTLPALKSGDPTYANCAFEGDLFSFTESKQNRYSGSLKVIQTTG